MSHEIIPGGPTKREAQEVNKQKSAHHLGLGIADKIALGLTGLGVGSLAGTAIDVQKQTPPPPLTQQDQRGPIPPPKGITFPEGVRGDSSAPSTFRVLLPNVANKFKEEPPLRFLEFGNLETDKILFINKGEKAWVEMGDPELYQNLLKIRDEYSFHPNLKRRIYFYETYEQLRDTSGVPYDYPNHAQVWQWGAYVRQIPIFDENDQFIGLRDYPPTFKNGEIRWQKAPDGAIEFHISLPEPLPGILPAPEQITYLNAIGFDSGLPLLKFIFSGPDGPYNGMTDRYPQAERKKYPLAEVISRHDHNYIFPVKLVYKEPPHK